MRMQLWSGVALVGMMLFSGTMWSAETTKDKPAAPEVKKEWKEETSETTNTVKIKGKEIRYKVTTGNILLKDSKDEAKAMIFYMAYTLTDTKEVAKRPIAFCFNGGPGASSVWLHIGALGPRRIVLDNGGTPILPYRVEPNEESLLDQADLVFIDPVSTGYSRAMTEEETKKYHGLEEDIKSVGEFIRLYTTRNNRWGSPKYLVGESYGTTRAAGLSLYLQDNYDMVLDGLILISTALCYQAFDFKPGNDLPFVTFFPSYAATAWHHKKLSPELQNNLPKTLKEVEAFAGTEYLVALAKGDLLTAEEKNEIAQKLSRYTGLPLEYILQQNLRVSMPHFGKQLLRSEGELIGRFDGRFKGLDFDQGGEIMAYDPILETMRMAFTAAFNQYVRTDLKWEIDEEYRVLTNVFPWEYSSPNQFVYLNNDLREVMTKNPRLKVFVASGLYDLATPYYSAKYTFNHLNLQPPLKNHLRMENYEGGHMMFLSKPVLVKLKHDLTTFISNGE